MYFHIGFGGLSGFAAFASGLVPAADAADAGFYSDCKYNGNRHISGQTYLCTAGGRRFRHDPLNTAASSLLIKWATGIKERFRQ